MSSDGATTRRARLQDILNFIKLENEASTDNIQNMMLLKWGLKVKTTSIMIQDLARTGIIRSTRDGKWTLQKGRAVQAYLDEGKEKGDTRGQETETGSDDAYIG